MTYVVVELCVDCKYTDCARRRARSKHFTNCLTASTLTPTPVSIAMPACRNVRWKRSSPTTTCPENYAHWTQINIDESS